MNKCVRAMIRDKNNQVILLKHNGMGVYTFPGGKVDSGESVQSAIVREVKEEIDLDIGDVNLSKRIVFMQGIKTKYDEEIFAEMTFFDIRVDNFDSVSNKEPESHEDMIFMDLSLLLKNKNDLMFDPAVRRFLSSEYIDNLECNCNRNGEIKMEFRVEFNGAIKCDAKSVEDAIDVASEKLSQIGVSDVTYNHVLRLTKNIVVNGEIANYNDEITRFKDKHKMALDYPWFIRYKFEKYLKEIGGLVINYPILTPMEYVNTCLPGCVIPENVTIAQFDEITSEYGVWNYPLSETNHIIDSNIDVLLVQFSDGIRLVEVR